MNPNWNAPGMSCEENSNSMLLVEGKVKDISCYLDERRGGGHCEPLCGHWKCGKAVDTNKCLERMCHHSRVCNPRERSGLRGKTMNSHLETSECFSSQVCYTLFPQERISYINDSVKARVLCSFRGNNT